MASDMAEAKSFVHGNFELCIFFSFQQTPSQNSHHSIIVHTLLIAKGTSSNIKGAICKFIIKIHT